MKQVLYADQDSRRQNNYVCKQRILRYRQNLLHFLEYFCYTYFTPLAPELFF